MPVSRRGSPLASTYDVMLIQDALKVAGLYAGPVDGVAGAKTMLGVRAWKRRHGLPVDDALDARLLATVREVI